MAIAEDYAASYERVMQNELDIVRDVSARLEAAGTGYDTAYMDEWTKALGLTKLWQETRG